MTSAKEKDYEVSAGRSRTQLKLALLGEIPRTPWECRWTPTFIYIRKNQKLLKSESESESGKSWLQSQQISENQDYGLGPSTYRKDKTVEERSGLFFLRIKIIDGDFQTVEIKDAWFLKKVMTKLDRSIFQRYLLGHLSTEQCYDFSLYRYDKVDQRRLSAGRIWCFERGVGDFHILDRRDPTSPSMRLNLNF